MKKVLSVLLLLTLIFIFAACGNSGSEDEAASGGIKFVQGFDPDFPPYSYMGEDGNYVGFDVELCQAVCNYLGWTYEPFTLNWDAKTAELNSGSCDCIWCGFTINGREDDYLWSIPYSDNEQMILVPADSEIKTLADLEGKVVGVQISTSAQDMLDREQVALKETLKEMKIYETYTIAFNDMKAGGCDALAIDITTANYQIEKNPDYPCVFLDEILGTEQYGIGFRMDDTEKCEKVNEALRALNEDGTVAEIAAKYPEAEPFVNIN